MSKILKCIIIDDEEGAHLVLRHYIKDLKQLQLKESFYNPVEAMDYMYANPVDLVFLDINMPGMSGLQMLKALHNPPLVILTTAYKEYALESYEYRVVDYLVKPFDLARFMAAIENVFSRFPKLVESSENLVNNLISKEPFIILKVDGHVIKVNYNEITHIQSWGNYIKVFTTNGYFLSPTTTTETEQKLDKKLFMRIHKSYIIALKRISKISGGQVELDTGLILPVGNTYRRSLLEYFQ
ncbi:MULTISPECIES: LytR/AlgR family response regulator transcription factor [Elizabethkingia]|uniref:DNA-binding response regulator n=1 Tax=Elizabethkingia anophelis TaxID=1117645 RepID=A0A1T3J8X2_9FLAO|nr:MULTISPECIES: LytTR family DNA-binding domain-containing protein [Elizabethkingia]AQW96724.1 DNA-binding response regulator [Elizabethkingia anophelis]AQX52357.1 LytTR family transcriptional regulator [Elizabethkingia anophelis]AQX90639.1 LytTR family transcriptional regulator [Elizabethkingia anophelis]EHM7981791.1 response regulator transcription factor [Elizabethkingia anophelis]EHM8032289.1 response regulator transcription factor [Elizabethkingia anophelis]